MLEGLRKGLRKGLKSEMGAEVRILPPKKLLAEGIKCLLTI